MSKAPLSAPAEPGFKAEHFADLYEMEAANFWFRARNRIIIWALRKYFPRAQTFLEVGCGTGFVLTEVRACCPHLTVAGSELFEEGLVYARKRLPGVELLQLDARALSFENRFDVIGAFDVLEHIEEDETVLSELWKATRHGLVLTVPQHRFLWSVIDDLGGHKRRYSASELRRKVEVAGFQVVRMTSFVSFLLPLLALSRFKKRNATELDKSEFEIPRTLDRILEIILDVEQWFIRAGFNFPAGGSLLMIATKRQR